jgi:hypothetical protein
MSMEPVLMYHPNLEGVAETNQDAFDVVWKDKSWLIVDPESDLAGMSKQQLTDLATQKGVDLSNVKTKADIAAALSETVKNG